MDEQFIELMTRIAVFFVVGYLIIGIGITVIYGSKTRVMTTLWWLPTLLNRGVSRKPDDE